jgi:hypothetical protein
MTQQTDPNVQRLASLTEYRQYLASMFTVEEAEDCPLLLALIAFEMTLQRRIDKRLPTPEWCEVMKWAVAESNVLLDAIYDEEFDAVDNWNPAIDKPANGQQALAATLMTLAHEVLGDLGKAEKHLWEELKTCAEDYAHAMFAVYGAEQALGAEQRA